MVKYHFFKVSYNHGFIFNKCCLYVFIITTCQPAFNNLFLLCCHCIKKRPFHCHIKFFSFSLSCIIYFLIKNKMTDLKKATAFEPNPFVHFAFSRKINAFGTELDNVQKGFETHLTIAKETSQEGCRHLDTIYFKLQQIANEKQQFEKSLIDIDIASLIDLFINLQSMLHLYYVDEYKCLQNKIDKLLERMDYYRKEKLQPRTPCWTTKATKYSVIALSLLLANTFPKYPKRSTTEEVIISNVYQDLLHVKEYVSRLELRINVYRSTLVDVIRSLKLYGRTCELDITSVTNQPGTLLFKSRLDALFTSTNQIIITIDTFKRDIKFCPIPTPYGSIITKIISQSFFIPVESKSTRVSL